MIVRYNAYIRLFALLSLNVLFSEISHASGGQSELGGVSAAFLEVMPSVRIAALGGDQVAAQGEISSLYSNPAGIQSLSLPQLWFTHNQSVIQTNTNTLAYGFPLKNQAFAFSAHHVDFGSQQRIGEDVNGNPIEGLGQFRFSTTLLNSAYSHRVFQKSSIGIGIKGWENNLDGASSHGWASDLGLLTSAVLPGLDVGFAYRNLGPKSDGHPLPRSGAVGFSYHGFSWPVLNRVALFSELDFAPYRRSALRSGIEFKENSYWLRVGYQNLTNELADPLSQFSFGGGFRIKGIRLDYAWLPRGDLGDQQRLAVTFDFGLTPEEKLAAAREVDKAMEHRMKERASQYALNGQSAFQRGDWAQAFFQFRQALQWNPNDRESSARLKTAQEKIKTAEVDRLYQEGQALANQDQWLDAAFKWQQVLKIKPDHKEAQQSLLKAEKNIQKGQKAYDKGIHDYLSGNYDEALKEWARVLKSDPHKPYLREYIEKAKNKKLELELAAVKQEKPAAPQQLDALNQQAYTLYMLGRTDKAIATWEKVLVVDPENKDAIVALKEARTKQELTKNTDLAPSRRRVDELNTEAMNAYSEGRLEQAAAIWKRALSIDPKNRWIQNNLNRVESEAASQSPTRKEGE